MNITPVLPVATEPLNTSPEAINANLLWFTDEERVIRGDDSDRFVPCIEGHLVTESASGQWHEVPSVDPDSAGTPLPDGSREWFYLCEEHAEEGPRCAITT